MAVSEHLKRTRFGVVVGGGERDSSSSSSDRYFEWCASQPQDHRPTGLQPTSPPQAHRPTTGPQAHRPTSPQAHRPTAPQAHKSKGTREQSGSHQKVEDATQCLENTKNARQRAPLRGGLFFAAALQRQRTNPRGAGRAVSRFWCFLGIVSRFLLFGGILVVRVFLLTCGPVELWNCGPVGL